MKEYKCIACGEVKQSTERCMCPICGYMMYELPNERKSVLIGEITDFVRAIINQKIDIKSVDFGKLDSDIHRFPDYDKIKNHVSKAEKTEEFYKRLTAKVPNKMKQYFHDTFRKTYDGKMQFLKVLSDSTAEYLDSVLPKLGIEASYEKVNFPLVSVAYEENANHELLPLADTLIERILQLADKMYKFIRINNIYGRAYDIKTKAFKFKGKTEDFDWRSAIKERISACDKVIAKKYVVEMLMDRIAASKIYMKDKYTDTSPLEYYLHGIAGDWMHKDTRALLEELLYMLAADGEEKTFDYIRNTVLKTRDY